MWFYDPMIVLNLEAPIIEKVTKVIPNSVEEPKKKKKVMPQGIKMWREVRAQIEPRYVDSERKARDKSIKEFEDNVDGWNLQKKD